MTASSQTKVTNTFSPINDGDTSWDDFPSTEVSAILDGSDHLRTDKMRSLHSAGQFSIPSDATIVGVKVHNIVSFVLTGSVLEEQGFVVLPYMHGAVQELSPGNGFALTGSAAARSLGDATQKWGLLWEPSVVNGAWGWAAYIHQEGIGEVNYRYNTDVSSTVYYTRPGSPAVLSQTRTSTASRRRRHERP